MENKNIKFSKTFNNTNKAYTSIKTTYGARTHHFIMDC